MGSAQTPITGETAPSEPPRLPRPALALFDLDGTLLHETQWLPGARDILDTLTAAGVPIAFCSGRAGGPILQPPTHSSPGSLRFRMKDRS